MTANGSDAGAGVHAPFAGRVALVTGAGSGVGAGVARRFVRAGAAVIAVDVDEPGLEALRAEVDSDRLLATVADVTDLGAVEAAVAAGRERYGTVDTVTAIAGIARFAMFGEMSDADRDAVIGVNFFGVWNSVAAALPDIRASRREGRPGRVILCGSIESVLGSAGLTAYVAAKHAVVGLAKSLALELAPELITANVISPAGIDTPMLRRVLTDETRRHFEASTPIARLSTPDEVAAFFLFVAGEDAAYMTGENIVVDGGTKVVNAHLVAMHGSATGAR